MISDIYNILLELRSTSKKLEKKSILKKYKDNEELSLFFKYALNKELLFNIKKIPDVELVSTDNNIEFSEFIDLLDLLNNRTYTGNLAIEKVSELISRCNSIEKEVFSCILSRDPNCGVKIKNAAEIWPQNFNTDVKLCKASPYSLKSLKRIKYPAYSQVKMDGARCLIRGNKDHTIDILSSGQKKYHDLITLESESNKFYEIYPDGFILDGELLVIDPSTNKYIPRQEANGITMKSIENTISQEEINNCRLVVWDIIDLESYNNGKSTILYKDNFNKLEEIFNKYQFNYIKFIQYKIVNSYEEAFSDFKEKVSNGEEGVIIKNFDFFWEGKRLKHLVKFKVEFEVSLRIIDVLNGAQNSKYENMLGSISCESEDGLVKVSVGSGFSDQQRNDFFNDKDNLIGKIIEVQSNSLIKNDNNTYSLFLPRFKELRYDKLEADNFETIQTLSSGSSMLKK